MSLVAGGESMQEFVQPMVVFKGLKSFLSTIIGIHILCPVLLVL